MTEKNNEHTPVPEASVHRAVLAEGQARAFVVQATPLVQRLREVHSLSRLAGAPWGASPWGP